MYVVYNVQCTQDQLRELYDSQEIVKSCARFLTVNRMGGNCVPIKGSILLTSRFEYTLSQKTPPPPYILNNLAKIDRFNNVW